MPENNTSPSMYSHEAISIAEALAPLKGTVGSQAWLKIQKCRGNLFMLAERLKEEVENKPLKQFDRFPVVQDRAAQ